MKEDSAAHFHPVPAVRRMREKDAKEPGKPEHEDHSPVTRTEVATHDDGSAHVVAHHKDGHAKIHEHGSVHEAHQHAEHLQSGGDDMNSDGHLSDNPLAPPQDQADAGAGDQAPPEECPHCGAEMQDGKCPQCGYAEQEPEPEQA